MASLNVSHLYIQVISARYTSYLIRSTAQLVHMCTHLILCISFIMNVFLPYSLFYRSETIVGCAFAMHRENFLAMGGFDEGMNIWGGENIEIGLRVSI